MSSLKYRASKTRYVDGQVYRDFSTETLDEFWLWRDCDKKFSTEVVCDRHRRMHQRDPAR